MPTSKLTAKLLDNLTPPQSGRTEYWDEDVRGLGLRLTPTGAATWNFIYRIAGRPRRMTIGKYPEMGLADARKEARAATARVYSGIDPALERKEAHRTANRRREQTFKVVAEQFIEEHCKRNNKTWRKTELNLNSFVIPKWGELPLASITRADAISLVETIERKSGAFMARYVRANIRKLFVWAQERDLIDSNPCERIPRPLSGQRTDRDRVLKHPEVKKLWEAAEAMGWPYGPLIKVLLYTAQRKGEVANMRWADLDLDNALWRIPREATKADRAQELPLAPEVVALLRSLPRFDGGGCVFTYDGKKAVNSFGAAKSELDTLSEVKSWKLHDLRRTAATNLAEHCAASMDLIALILNHASVGGVTRIYNRATRTKDMRVALDDWARLLDKIVTGKADAKIVAFPKAAR